MKRCRAVVRSDYFGCDQIYEFEVQDDCTEQEMNKEAWEVIKDNLEWYAEFLDE